MFEQQTSPEGHESFFFYGTLLVPDILVRVLGHNCDDLTFQSALLPDYSRHHIVNEDYPAIIPRNRTLELYANHDLPPPEDITVRGTLVHGLTAKDVSYLDTFEAEEYTRKKLSIQPLSGPARLTPLSSTTQPETVSSDKETQFHSSEAWVYVWTEKLSLLDPAVWSYEQFMTDKARSWVGRDKEEMYSDVEAQRHPSDKSLTNGGMVVVEEPSELEQEIPDGDESLVEGKVVEGFEDFGHNMLKYWMFEPGLINMNNGAYGSPPKPVLEAMRALQDKIESNPNLYLKKLYFEPHRQLRRTLAKMVNALEDEVVLVPNTSHGVNNIINNIKWEAGDVIIMYSTTYGSCAQAIKFLCDRHDGVTVEVIDIAFPTSFESILQKTLEVVEKYNDLAVPSYTGDAKPNGKHAEKRVRLLLVDAIASLPGVTYPWEDIVRLCKEYGILSLVDAAHAIGQVKFDVKKADCDFLVTNCHKWLFSQRSNALMYIPLRNQRLVGTSYPASYMYDSVKYPSNGPRRTFVEQYEWPATLDWIPYLAIADAVKFRESIGGEERIMRYIHTLAVQGGRRVFKKWGTSIMENTDLSTGELTAAMINVELPLLLASDRAEIAKQSKYIENAMFERKVYASVFIHGGKAWMRFSAQVWIELSDFDRMAEVLIDICDEIKRGEHEEVKVADPEAAPELEAVPQPEA